MVRLWTSLSFIMAMMTMIGTVAAGPASTTTAAAAGFVSPASPWITTSTPAPSHAVLARHEAVKRGYRLVTTTTPTTATTTLLWAAAKKKGSGGSSSSSSGGGGSVSSTASKKMQVKLLKHVAGTGQAGDVILVAPAFFQNKLRPTKSAIPITDEEVAKSLASARAQEMAMNERATALRDKLKDVRFTISRKAGPDGQLFGAVNPKVILEELRLHVKDDEHFLNEKQVKVVSVTEGGQKVTGDIKHVGEFQITISLTKEIVADFTITVDAEKH